MDFLIVTGVSGAGKSQTVHTLEDIGYFCIDNIPANLAEPFFDLCRKTNGQRKYAAVIDVRSHSISGDFRRVYDTLVGKGDRVKILYLDAADDVLLRRFQETRRRHPLLDDTTLSVATAIARERDLLAEIRELADYRIDTSLLGTAQLRERLVALFAEKNDAAMAITVLSFGFKHGLPVDADLVFDVRCLPNPYYIPTLRPLTGMDVPVREYVFSFPEAQQLLRQYRSLLELSIPLYRKEGKSSLVIAFGCTGGHHRSVSFAEVIGAELAKTQGETLILHRDTKR